MAAVPVASSRAWTKLSSWGIEKLSIHVSRVIALFRTFNLFAGALQHAGPALAVLGDEVAGFLGA